MADPFDNLDPYSQEPVSKKPPAPAPSDDDQDRLDRQAAREQQGRLMGALERTMGERHDIFAEEQRQLEPQRRDLMSSMQRASDVSAGATKRFLAQQRDIPEAPKNTGIRDDAFAWMSIAAGFGAIAGGLSRYHTTAALNAFGATMKGFAEGNHQAVEQNYKQWEANAERAHELNARATREYNAIMQDQKLDVDTKANLMKLTASKFEDQLMINAADSRDIQQMSNILNTQTRIGDNYYMQMLKLQQKKEEMDKSNKVKLAVAGLEQREDGSIGIDKTPGSPAYKRAEQIAAYDQAPPSTSGGRNMGMTNELMSLVDDISMEKTGQHYDASRWTGKLAYQRAAGAYGARVETATNEVSTFIPQALDASGKLPRGKWVPINKVVQDFQAGKSDPRYYDFAFANYSLINAYTRAINPAGVPRIQDKEHAAQLLSTATSQEAYKRVLLRMAKEVRASHAAVAMTRGEIDPTINATNNILQMNDQQLDQFITGNAGNANTVASGKLGDIIAGGGRPLRITVPMTPGQQAAPEEYEGFTIGAPGEE